VMRRVADAAFLQAEQRFDYYRTNAEVDVELYKCDNVYCFMFEHVNMLFVRSQKMWELCIECGDPCHAYIYIYIYMCLYLVFNVMGEHLT
jgi:hypothetical protein